MKYVYTNFAECYTSRKKKKKRDVEKQTYVYISLADKMEKIGDRTPLLRLKW